MELPGFPPRYPSPARDYRGVDSRHPAPGGGVRGPARPRRARLAGPAALAGIAVMVLAGCGPRLHGARRRLLRRAGLDDVGFITAMVSAIGRGVPVDPRRVYATGISNGGIMAYTLACHTTLFAAIGPDSATERGGCPDPARLSVIAIHGTADRNIPYGGGRGDGIAHIDGPAIPALNASWRRTDHCASPVTKTAGVVTTSAARCPAGRAVEVITIAGAGHQWPGAEPDLFAQKLLHTDPPSTALNATRVIWRFFAAHPRPRR